MDCQHTGQTLAGPLLRRLLSQLDLFMPNAAEARILTQAESVEQALEILAEYTPYVIIKDGANGAYARYQGRTYHAPAIPVTPLDTTGAGDVFNAGFLAAYLQGHNPQECLRWGNFGGGRSTEGPGGISTAPTLAELEKWLAGN
jgi:sugar/nucleoside kinase (ribokinase family)